MNQYRLIMEKHLRKSRSGLTEKGKLKQDKLILDLGKIGLNQSLDFAKALIENYFLNEKCSKPILDRIEKYLLVSKIVNKEK